MSMLHQRHKSLRLPYHYASSAVVQAELSDVFAYADDSLQLSSHMSQSSWMMGGGRMAVELDKDKGKKRGSLIRLSGRAFGVRLSVAEIVIERSPPHRKVWETTASPRLIVIGHYRMGFEITPHQHDSLLRVFIDYALPDTLIARWLARIGAAYYARWCTRQMVADTVRHFCRSRSIPKP